MPEPMTKTTHRGKCVICGDSTVGKSAITQVYCSDGAQYPKTYNMTTGVDLTVKNISVSKSSGTVEMFLYDTAGKDAFDNIVDPLLKKADMVVYVYDITNKETFKNVTQWHKKVTTANDDKPIPGVLVGNKLDLTERQVISTEWGQELASKLGLELFEISAKEMRQVDLPFTYLANEFHSRKTMEH